MKSHYVIPGLWSVESLCLRQSSIQKTVCSVETLYYIIVLYVLMVFLYWMWMHCVVEERAKRCQISLLLLTSMFYQLQNLMKSQHISSFQSFYLQNGLEWKLIYKFYVYVLILFRSTIHTYNIQIGNIVSCWLWQRI